MGGLPCGRAEPDPEPASPRPRVPASATIYRGYVLPGVPGVALGQVQPAGPGGSRLLHAAVPL